MEIDTSGYDDIIESWVSCANGKHDLMSLPTHPQLSHLVKGFSMQGWGNLTNVVKPLTELKGEIRIKGEWGDAEGAKVSISGSVSVKDDHGDYVKGTVSQDNQGNTDAELIVGADIKEDKDK